MHTKSTENPASWSHAGSGTDNLAFFGRATVLYSILDRSYEPRAIREPPGLRSGLLGMFQSIDCRSQWLDCRFDGFCHPVARPKSANQGRPSSCMYGADKTDVTGGLTPTYPGDRPFDRTNSALHRAHQHSCPSNSVEMLCLCVSFFLGGGGVVAALTREGRGEKETRQRARVCGAPTPTLFPSSRSNNICPSLPMPRFTCITYSHHIAFVERAP